MPQSARLCLIVAVGMTVGGCGSASLVQGVLASADFALQSEQPLAKQVSSGRDMVVVLAERGDETLSVVTVTLPGHGDLPLGEPIAVGPGGYGDERPSISASHGPLVIETRADGVELLSAADPAQAVSAAGAFILDERGPGSLAGRFHVELDDGGYLDGELVVSDAR